jgi:propionyl-CoA carboxylase alpha chain
VRNDAGVREGDEISMFYDPMISKLCTWGATRAEAVAGMGRALEDFHIEGPGHNVPFLAAVMDQERFKSGALSTSYIKDEFPEGFRGTEPTSVLVDLLTAAAAYMHRLIAARARRAGNGLAGALARAEWTAVVGEGAPCPLVLMPTDGGLDVALPEAGRTLQLRSVDWRPGRAQFRGVLDGVPFTAEVAPAAEGFTIRHRAAKARVLVLTPLSAELHGRLPKREPADTSKLIVSPMPGLVVALDVFVGQEVKAGETVAIIEAMKMQNIIRAERDGVVKTVGAKAGDSVAADEVLVEFG